MKKIKRNKNIIKVTLGLAAVALGTVGFSSWIIATNTSADATGLLVSADQVEDRSLTISNVKVDDSKIVFGSNTQGNGDVISSDAKTEDLTLKFSFDITTADNKTPVSTYLENVSLTMTVMESKGKAAFEQALADKYFTFPLTVGKETNIITAGTALTNLANNSQVSLANQSMPKATVNVTLNFAWGEYFSNKNPYDYYNKNGATLNEANPQTAEQAKIVLPKLASATDTQLKITITPTSKTATPAA